MYLPVRLSPRVVLVLTLRSNLVLSRAVAAPNNQQSMGNVVRMARYDRAANVAAAIPSPLTLNGKPLEWHRLDDGVMGGQSETVHSSSLDGRGGIHFTGHINTDGGGFASIRAPFENGLSPNTKALRINFRGDGKTYKVLLSDGGSSGPWGGSPSWQVDLPTRKLSSNEAAQVETLPLDSFIPSFGGRSVLREEASSRYTFDGSEMRQLGLMLSLRLSDGSPNPKETFGEGIFEFSLFVESIEAISSKSETSDDDDDNAEETAKGDEL